MHWIFDHLVAFIMAGIILFILLAISLRTQEASVEAIQFDAAKTGIHLMASIIEQDVSNMGAGFLAPGATGLTIDTTSTERSVSFFTRTDPGIPNPQRVTYRWQPTGEQVTLRSGDVVDLMTLERRVGDTGPWDPLMENMLTDLRITLRDQDLNIIFSDESVTLGSTRRIDVNLRMISPLGKGDLIEEVQWNRQFRPLNLQRDSGSILLQD